MGVLSTHFAITVFCTVWFFGRSCFCFGVPWKLSHGGHTFLLHHVASACFSSPPLLRLGLGFHGVVPYSTPLRYVTHPLPFFVVAFPCSCHPSSCRSFPRTFSSRLSPFPTHSCHSGSLSHTLVSFPLISTASLLILPNPFLSVLRPPLPLPKTLTPPVRP